MLRFAQSPTGDMSISDLRVAVVNYILSQQKSEPFLIRIDDTPKEKVIEGKDTEIMQIMEKFALKHDTVFHQSEHLSMHQTLAVRLLEEEKAFVCTCTLEPQSKSCKSGRCGQMDKAQLAKIKETQIAFVTRLKRSESDIVIEDIIQGGNVIASDAVGEMIILHEDATPASHFASACDDMLSEINFLVKESTSLLETAKEEHIKKMLGYEAQTAYAHLPEILNADVALKELFAEGFIPDAILNYLLLLGNNHAPEEIFTLPEAIEWFNLEEISKIPESFDKEKLHFINAEHLRRLDDKRLSTLFGFADADIGKLAKLYLGEASTIDALESKIRPIFSSKDFEGEWGEEMRTLEKLIWELPMIDSYEEFKRTIMNKSGLKEKEFEISLRLLITGAQDGPKLSEIYPLIKPYLLEVAS